MIINIIIIYVVDVVFELEDNCKVMAQVHVAKRSFAVCVFLLLC